MASAGGTLYVVSTPIGNLADLSPRAIEVLGGVAAVLAEDTRHTRTLWERFGLHTPLLAHHEHNEAESTPGLVARLRAGESFAMVTDAGTPLVSDPGARLVRAAIDAGITVSPIPGPSALLAALVGSGLDAEAFTFLGFLPRKGAERAARLAAIGALGHTVALYEAPPRLAETLDDLVGVGLGERPAVVARELTKRFEEFRRGTVATLASYYRENEPRGEIVLMIGGGATAPLDEGALRQSAARMKAEGRSPREVMQALMADARVGRNLAYRIAHE